MRAVVWTRDPIASALHAHLGEISRASSAATLFGQGRQDTIAYVDASALASLDSTTVPSCPVIAVSEGPQPNAIGWLVSYPWLSHVVSASMLQHPLAAEHLANVNRTLTSPKPRLVEWLSPETKGRRVRLAHAHKRSERLEKMTAYFDQHGVSSRTQEQLRDVAEELLTNAFYDAPVAAGVVNKPISRTQDVLLPEESACDLVYGQRDDLAVVRVRDPFGSLSRARLMEVLARCAQSDMQVQVDETMGGAGLGLWRIFTVATFVAISVVHGKHTEFLVGIAKRAGGARPFAFHLFFQDPGRTARRWKLLDHDTSEPSLNRSVAMSPE